MEDKSMYTMKKRVIAVILVVLVGIVTLTSCFLYRLHAEEDMITYEQYKADYYLDYSPYSYNMSSDFTLPYRTTVEKNSSSKVYQTLINAWQVGTFNLSNVTEYSKKRVGYYEAFLFDILYTGYEPENITRTMNKSVKSIQASSLKKVCKLLDTSISSYSKTNIANMTDSEKEALGEALQSCDELGEVFGAISGVEKVLNYASDVEELIYKLAKIEAISHLANENGDVLEKIASKPMINLCRRLVWN